MLRSGKAEADLLLQLAKRGFLRRFALVEPPSRQRPLPAVCAQSRRAARQHEAGAACVVGKQHQRHRRVATPLERHRLALEALEVAAHPRLEIAQEVCRRRFRRDQGRLHRGAGARLR